MKPRFFAKKPFPQSHQWAGHYHPVHWGKLEHRLVKWGIGWALSQAAVIAALVKLL